MKEGWTYKKLGEVCEVVSGSTPKTNVSEYWGKGHYWVTPAEINDSTLYVNKTERQITDLALQATNLRLMPVGTVLLSSRAPIGKVAITNTEMYCNQGFKNCICSNVIYNKYLFYYLRYKKDYLNSLGRGATFKEISKSIVEQIVIPLPSFSKQQSIVAELDKIKELISLKKAQLLNLDSLAQCFFYEMFGDPITNEKGWVVKKLGEVSYHITDGDHMPPPKSDTGVPFITISNIDKEQRVVVFDNTFFVPHSYYDSISELRKPQKNDILYTVTGSYGLPILIKNDKIFCFQRHIALIRPRTNLIVPTFIFYWALNKSVKQLADQVATGIAQKTVSLNSLRNFEIVLPPLSLQQSFAHKIEAIEQQKSLIRQSLTDPHGLLV